MEEYVIIRGKSKSIDKIKKFVEDTIKLEDNEIIISDNLAKEYWINEFENLYYDEITKKTENHNKTRREILEEEFGIFESSRGWENTEGFDGWTNYVPEDFLNKW